MAEVIWTEPALNALDAIGDHIALENHDAACGLIRKVFEKVDLLEGHPQLRNIPKHLRNTPYRRLVIKPVYLYYRNEGDTVVIVFVERTERDFEMSRLIASG
jgi:toxin ParE1/3/4